MQFLVLLTAIFVLWAVSYWVVFHRWWAWLPVMVAPLFFPLIALAGSLADHSTPIMKGVLLGIGVSAAGVQAVVIGKIPVLRTRVVWMTLLWPGLFWWSAGVLLSLVFGRIE